MLIAPGVEMDREHAFGRPRIQGTCFVTHCIGDRFKAGDSVRELCSEYGQTARAIENAIRYELYKTRKQRQAEREMMR